MKRSVTRLIVENICLLIPLIIYGIYKNGYLIYQKNLISILEIFKPIVLTLISVLIKIIIDYVRYKKIRIDYNLVYVILISMIMPYNINIFLYMALFAIVYILTLFLDKFLKVNKVCFIYLIIILIHFLLTDFTFFNTLEQNYNFSFRFIDYFFGRSIGSISTTNIFLSLVAYIYLINSFYYKKDIPFVINLTYLILAFIYFFITKNSGFLLNSELIFASIFVCALPEYSPYKVNHQIIYAVCIGVFSFILSITFNSIIAVYLVTFIMSIVNLLLSRLNLTK